MGILKFLCGIQSKPQTSDVDGLAESLHQVQEVVCPACVGSGYFYDPEREQNEVCPTCGGSGIIEE